MRVLTLIRSRYSEGGEGVFGELFLCGKHICWTLENASKKIPSAAMPALKDRYVSETDQKLANLPYMKLYLNNKNCSSRDERKQKV